METPPAPGDVSSSGWAKITCMLPPDAVDLWLAAREKIAPTAPHPAVANGQVLELLCADYLAGPCPSLADYLGP